MPPRRSAMIGSNDRRRATSCPMRSPTAVRSSACTGSGKGWSWATSRPATRSTPTGTSCRDEVAQRASALADAEEPSVPTTDASRSIVCAEADFEASHWIPAGSPARASKLVLGRIGEPCVAEVIEPARIHRKLEAVAHRPHRHLGVERHVHDLVDEPAPQVLDQSVTSVGYRYLLDLSDRRIAPPDR